MSSYSLLTLKNPRNRTLRLKQHNAKQGGLFFKILILTSMILLFLITFMMTK